MISVFYRKGADWYQVDLPFTGGPLRQYISQSGAPQALYSVRRNGERVRDYLPAKDGDQIECHPYRRKKT